MTVINTLEHMRSSSILLDANESRKTVTNVFIKKLNFFTCFVHVSDGRVVIIHFHTQQ